MKLKSFTTSILGLLILSFSAMANNVSTGVPAAEVAGEAYAEGWEAIAKEAALAYEARDFTAAGKVQAEKALGAYMKLGLDSADNIAQKKMNVSSPLFRELSMRLLEAAYFAADVQEEGDLEKRSAMFGFVKDKSTLFLSFLGIHPESDEGFAKGFSQANVDNLKSKLDEESRAYAAELLYYNAISLGKWAISGNIKDQFMRMSSNWDRMVNSLKLINALGYEGIHEYGASRALGRAHFKVPLAIYGLGPSKMEIAKENLKLAWSKTRRPGSNFISVNPYNNLYYAQFLADDDDNQERLELAIKILQEFVDTPAEEVNSRLLPETKFAQAEAKRLLQKLSDSEE